MSRASPRIKAHNKKATGSRLETMDLGISSSSGGIVETSKKSSRVKPVQDQNINHQTTAKAQLNVKLEAKGETALKTGLDNLVEIMDRPPNVSAGADKVSIIEASSIDGQANSNSVNFVPQAPSLDSTGRDDTDLSQANFLSEHRSSCHRCGKITL